ncbi:MAG: hypothetical protein HN742_00265 [Lentisphaerae bacterium]|jgi:ABC-type transport system involved in multi-copper enzyme maturation permease subunit|nr:hypothetical protein [Lentisphaerota bacterium]MBT4815145.1 hypothetical protein [Lentisphaerota bacterium]MBT5608777.1 hypothetical protein [Lentisphaerota bacterium]MBT7058288.1 hypothetical protein [Lentisphaerota bacterium]MBT7840263.1 hypothetical protein [Lentisphaerota bacterium]
MLRLLDNPIFVREFRANTRCRKTLALTLSLLMSLAAIILILWPRSGIFSEINSNEIFSIFLNLNLALIALLVPGFVATTITQERENGSFDILFMTLLSSSQIMFGKLFSSLAITFLVVVISVPITAVCALSGGISVQLLLKAYSVILMATLTYGLMGLAISSLCHRSFTALVWTYLGILGLAGATWLPSVLLANLLGGQHLWSMVRSLSPFEALFALNHPERYELAMTGFSGGLSAEMVFRFYLTGMGLLSLFFLLIFCTFVLRPPAKRKGKSQEQLTDRRTLIKRKLVFPFYLIDPLKRKKPIAGWRNAIFVAEIRSRIFGKPKFIMRSLSTCVILSMGLLTLICIQFASTLAPDTVRLVAIIFQVGVVAFFAPAVCAGSITDERTSGTLTLLRMTGVPVRTVIFGKVKAGFLYVFIFLLSSLPVLLALRYFETGASTWRVAAWFLILVLTAAVFVVAGLAASTIAPSTGAATAISYAFSALICIGTLSVLLLGSRMSREMVAFVLCFNPLAAALQVTADTWFADLPQLFGNRLWQNHLVFLSATMVCLLVLTSVRVHCIFNHRER